jgi:hypothetical protein
MTPRGGRGMNTAIADGFDLGWKLAWVERGIAGPALLDTYEAERAPIGRRNVELSMAPGGGGTDDGLAEDLGAVVASAAIAAEPAAEPAADPSPAPSGYAFPPDGRPGSRAPHAWLSSAGGRVSTLDLFGRDLVLLAAGDAARWREAAGLAVTECHLDVPVRVVGVGRDLDDADGTFAACYGLADGGAVLVRPDGIVAWRWDEPPADAASALASAIAKATGHGTDEARTAASEAA